MFDRELGYVDAGLDQQCVSCKEDQGNFLGKLNDVSRFGPLFGHVNTLDAD